MSVNQDISAILTALASLTDPLSGQSIAHKIHERDISLQGKHLDLAFAPGYPLSPTEQVQIQTQIEHALAPLGIATIQIQWTLKIKPHKVQDGLRPMDKIKNIFAVSSGKGGVGKSTSVVNLAVALAHSGARVGILDADIYGPSLPLLLGLRGKPKINAEQQMVPHFAHGVWANSFGFLIDDEQAAIWRGPMVVQALNQLINVTQWPELDYLVIDMPPGTGDIALSLVQKIPVVGSVIVTTPQDLALLDVVKGVTMFQKVNVPILGILENMSTHICSNCGHEEPIFGEHGGEQMASRLNLAFLGGLPLNLQLRQQSDAGVPIVVAQPDSGVSRQYRVLARKVALAISDLAFDNTHKFPPIVVKQ